MWFFTSTDNGLYQQIQQAEMGGKAPRAMAHFASKGHDVWATVHGNLATTRDRATIDVKFGTSAGGDPASDRFDADARLEALAELAELGVTWCGAGVPGDSLPRALENLERFGELVIARA